MKKITTFFALSVLGIVSIIAQTIQPADLPLIVQSNFKNRFPTITDAKWTKDKEVYEAKFVNKDMNTEASYSEKGDWIETSWEIPVEYTPATIKSYIASNFPKYKIKEVEIEEVFPALEKVYSVEIAQKKDIQELFFKISGEFIKAEIEKKEVKKEEKKGDKK